MRIFLSYASEQCDLAESIALALRAEQHSVFFDRASLPSGDAYNEKIRSAIEDSDLFLFLVSPESVTRGRYTLTEVEVAERQWSNPSGHVLPVVVHATDLATVPAYLKAVTLLEPEGNIPAEVAAAVERMKVPRRFRRGRVWIAAAVVVALLAGLGGARSFLERRRLARETAALLASGAMQRQSRNYDAAWATSEQARALEPGNPDVERNAEDVAMAWIDDIRVTEGKRTFTDIVTKLEPVLSACGIAPTEHGADCLAHLGWATFLRVRDGQFGLDPTAYYKRAIAADPDNVYAHAMWGFDLLRNDRGTREAKPHFDAALASGRARPFVRQMQFAGLSWIDKATNEDEAIRIANEMRRQNETPAIDESHDSDFDPLDLWNTYYSRILTRSDTTAFLAAVPPEDHLATFEWQFPENTVPEDKRELRSLFLGTLQEHAGHRAEALATFTALRDRLAADGSLRGGGSLPDLTVAAVKRLSK